MAWLSIIGSALKAITELPGLYREILAQIREHNLIQFNANRIKAVELMREAVTREEYREAVSKLSDLQRDS